MKILVAYYSKSGTAADCANILKKDLAAANGVSVKEVLAAFSDPAFVALIPKEGEKKQETPTPLPAPSVGINGQNSINSLPQISPTGGSVR